MLIDTTRLTNVPARRSPLIGRQRELEEIRVHVLERGTRLLTLTGTGGAGKTTLALEAARSLSSDVPDGVWLIRLDPLIDPPSVAEAACSAMGLGDQAGASSAGMLTSYLALRDALLIFDNCEHVAGAAAALIDELLSNCPNLRVLATSRTPLSVANETVFAVQPLPVPDASLTDAALLAEAPAVQLFVARAAAARSGFALDAQNAASVSRICTALEGLPLALELAAARVRLLSCAEIADRLEGDIRLLRSNTTSAAARHRTLEATLDWSYALLPKTQQRLFRRLGVFSRGWNSRSLESICARLDGSSENVLEDLERLIDHSLVVAEVVRDGMRYRLLEPVRVFSLERLRAAGEEHDVSDAHTLHYLRYAASLAASGEVAHSDATGLQRIAEEYDNIERAGAWARKRGNATAALGACAGLLEIDRVRGHLLAGLRRMEAALALPGESDPTLRGSVLMAAADYARLLGEFEQATVLAREGERHFAALEYDGGISLARAILGDVAADRGDFQRARALYQEAFSLLDPDADEDLPSDSMEHRGRAWWYSNVGIIAFRQGNFEEANHFLEEGARRMRLVGGWYYGRVLAYQARLALIQANPERSGELLRQALTWLQPYRAIGETAECLELMAEVALTQDVAGRAASLLGAASALRETLGACQQPDLQLHLDQLIEPAREKVGLAAFTDAWSYGRALSYDDAIALALDANRDDIPAVTVDGGEGSFALRTLTPREREVAALVAEGLTNRQIADRLCVSEGTARTHVERILGKLGVHSRVQVATLVTEQTLPRGGKTSKQSRRNT